MANKEVKVKVSAIDAASASLKKIGVEAENLGGQGQKFKVNWQQAGAAMTVAGGAIVGGMMAVTTQTANLGDALAKSSDKTGVSVESLSKLKFAAEQSGLSFQQLEGALARQARSANDASNGVKKAEETYARLGISVKDANGNLKDGETLFVETAGALQQIQSPTERAALAMDIFGRSGSQLLPMFKDGAAGIEQLTAQAESLGLVMSEKAARDSEKFNDSLSALKASLGSAGREMAVVVMPVVTEFATKLSDIVGRVTQWSEAHPTLTKGLTAVALGIGAVMTAVGPLLIALPALKSGFELLQLVKTAGNVNALAGALGGGKGLMGVLQGAPAVLKTAGTAVTAFGGKMAGMAVAGGPILIVIAALAALGVELYFLKKKWDEAAAAGKQAGDNFKQAMAAEDAYAAKTGTQAKVAKQREERENARVTMSDRFWGAMTGGGRTGKDIARERVAMGQAIPVAGKRAAGGPVLAGSMYLVGEDGPEYFTPKASGQIIPREKTEQRRPSTRNVARGGERSQAMQAYLANKPPVTVTQQAAAQIAVTPPVQPQKPMRSAQTRTVQAAPSATASGYNAPRQRATGGGDSIVIDLRLADGMIANVARQVLSSRDGRDIIIRTVKAQGARTVPQVAFGGYG